MCSIHHYNSVKPPVGNTGATLTQLHHNQNDNSPIDGCLVSIDWLTLSISKDFSFDDIVQLLREMGIFYLENIGGSRFYNNRSLFSSSVQLHYNPRENTGSPYYSLSLPGSACRMLSHEQILTIASLASNASRLDIAIDHTHFTASVAHDWCMKNQKRSHAKSYHYYKGKTNFSTQVSEKGNTLYIGSQRSNRYVRIYDTHKMPDHPGTCRLEMQLSGHRANQTLQFLFSISSDDYDKHAQFLVGLFCDYLDFVDTTVDTNISRCPRLPLWSAVVGDLQRVKIKLTKFLDDALQSSVEWFERSVSPMLSVLIDAGVNIPLLVSSARKRIKKSTRLSNKRNYLLSFLPPDYKPLKYVDTLPPRSIPLFS